MANPLCFIIFAFLIFCCAPISITATTGVNCTERNVYMERPSYNVYTRSSIGSLIDCPNQLNSTIIDQRLSTTEDPVTVTLIRMHDQPEHMNLYSTTLKPFVNLIKLEFNACGRDYLMEITHCHTNRETLSFVQSDAFKENRRLIELELIGVNFPTVENLRGVLGPLFDRLTKLLLNHCSFGGNDPFQVTSQFKNVTRCEIERGSLTMISANAFKKSAESLYKLRLAKNKITTIDVNAFNGLVKLKILVLYDNQIASIAPGTFDDLTSLESINLAKNPISNMPSTLFEQIQLQDLYISLIDNFSEQNFTGPANFTIHIL